MKRTIEESWQTIVPHLDEALDLEPDARQAWVAALETREPAIAAQVRSCLLEIARLDELGFLSLDASSCLGSASLQGQRFGAYTLDHAIGHGGTGTVWLAHRSDGRFEGRAAVKLLSVALVGHPSARRFAREGSVLAKLQHPNIAHLLDAGVASSGQPYLVLEYIPGERIDLYCARHKLNIQQRITLFLDVLAAVAHAHSNLIVHRDLKPSNILVTDDGVVKLLDFGVAALLSPDAGGTTELTHHIAPGLTPGYAAPEQLLREAVTTATDVYALGLVLFVLLVGRHPLDPGHKTPAELINLTLDGDVPRPSELASEARHARLLRGDLDNIIATALRRNAADRYTTAELFAQDLRRYLALEPVAARPRSIQYLAAKFMRRHRVSVGAGIAIALVLIGAVIATTAEMLEARQQRDRARYQTRQAEDSKEFLSLLMLSGFSSGRPARTFRDRVEFGVEMLNKQYRGNPKFSGRMLVEMAVGFRDNQETARADELYQQAYDIGRVNHDVELMAYAQCSRTYGDGYADIQKDVVGRLAEAQRLLEQLQDPNEDLQATCVMAQSMVEQRLGHSASAEALMRQEQRRLEAKGSTYRQIYIEVLEGLGEVYLARNQLRDALQVGQLAGQVLDRSGRGTTSARLVARQNVAVLMSAMGESRAALAEREVINRDAADVEGPGEEPIPYAINYARVLLIMARPAAALKALEGMPERARRTQNRSVLAHVLLGVGSACLQLHRWAEADAALKEAALVVADGTGNGQVSAQIEAELAQLDWALGERESADRHRDRALELAGYHGQQPERCLAKILLVAGRMALAEGAPTQAERFAHDALAISAPLARGPDTSADVGEALLRLAQARLASGSKAEIRPLLERAVRCLTNGLDANHPLTLEARALLARDATSGRST